MSTALENAEFEFNPEYLEEAYVKYQKWAQVKSDDDIRLTQGQGYISWFDHSDDKKTAKFNELGKSLFRASFRLDE
jgi:hypothetical protein